MGTENYPGLEEAEETLMRDSTFKKFSKASSYFLLGPVFFFLFST